MKNGHRSDQTTMAIGPLSEPGGYIWVDAKGTFLASAGAGPVYRLLGKKDLRTTEFPKRQPAASHKSGYNGVIS